MKLTKILCALLALLMLLACVSCDNPPPSVKDPSDEQGTTPGEQGSTPGEQNKNVLSIIKNGVSDYVMIRSDNAKPDVRAAFSKLGEEVLTKTGVKIEMDTDWAEKGSKEILIGNTNREESAKALQDLEDMQILEELVGDGFMIRVKGEKLIIVGTTDEATVCGVQYCINHYLKENQGSWDIAKPLEFVVSLQELLLGQDVVGSPLKKQYSDYVNTYTETPLFSFDELDAPGITTYEKVELDESYQLEGDAAWRFTITRNDKELTRLFWENGNAFSFAVADKQKTTLKFWLFVDDVDKVKCDHDDVYGKRQEGQATFFFRVFDDKGRVYAWNHTLTGDGWHEVELTFNIHNGFDEAFDFEHITSFGVLVAADQGTVIEFDDLRLVEYESDHTPEAAPEGGILITDAEYDAFDGAVIQEWYGASYDLENKQFGDSSLRLEGDSSVTDFRIIVSDLNIPLSYQNDTLVFWVNVENLANMDNIFIELNQVQDSHEYEKSFTKAELQQYGLSTKNGEWCEIAIPLSAFGKHLNVEKFGDAEDITLYAFRFVVGAHGNKTYVVHLDRVYLTSER